ncbi:MAG: tRNA (adenosine(37)-N6)-threonylcarbamoyltransferase complex ATPase subunit type 1 TsaE [Helicobacteraceae bacterium]|nr:tRNA (adenosine(37)-N6)-threonylcarbamoyltransferase complex ATPase subunit type 1 TsaE [Helicobacteraceae bacterium]
MESELSVVCEEIARRVKNGGVVILRGDLASGKTTLTRAFATYLNLDDEVTSPTFSLQQCYGEKLFHYDIYNKGVEHFLELGMLEELDRDGYHLVEWGDEKLIEILKKVQIPTIIVDITKQDTKREYKITNA